MIKVFASKEVFNYRLNLVTIRTKHLCHWGDDVFVDVGNLVTRLPKVVGSMNKEAIDLPADVSRRFFRRVDNVNQLSDFVKGTGLGRIGAVQ